VVGWNRRIKDLLFGSNAHIRIKYEWGKLRMPESTVLLNGVEERFFVKVRVEGNLN
jgi:hypothetical protein